MRSKQIMYFVVFMILVFLLHSKADADCAGGLEGEVVDIKVKSCEVIIPENNKEIQENKGQLYNTWNLNKAYTGALVTDEAGQRWMYSSESVDPCKEFIKGEVIKKKGYSTCCDTGKWGKCVFGGLWLSDVDGKSINAFQ